MWQNHLRGGKRNDQRVKRREWDREWRWRRWAVCHGWGCMWRRLLRPIFSNPNPPHLHLHLHPFLSVSLIFLSIHHSVIPSSTSSYSCWQFLTPVILEGQQCDHGFIIHPHPAQLLETLEIKYHKRWKELPTSYNINGICGICCGYSYSCQLRLYLQLL